MSNEKNEFIEGLKKRTKAYTIQVILFCRTIKNNLETVVIKKQIIRSVSSVGANYRASCIARSKNEFFHKISIVNEEIDETIFWLELLEELNHCNVEINKLIKEGSELRRIFAKARSSTGGRR